MNSRVEKTKKTKKRRLVGTIVSDKMQDTAVVLVERVKQHPLYRKRIKVSRRFKAHNSGNFYKLGERVVIEECRPISKSKKWRIIGKA